MGPRLEDITILSDLPIRLGGMPDIYLEMIPASDVMVPYDIAGIRPYPGYPDVQGSIIVRDLTVAGTEQGSIAFTIDTYGNTVVGVGQITRDLDTSVSWPLDDDQPIVLNARFNRVDLPLVVPPLEELFELFLHVRDFHRAQDYEVLPGTDCEGRALLQPHLVPDALRYDDLSP